MEGGSAQSKIKPSQKITLQTLLLNNQSENKNQKYEEKEEKFNKNNNHNILENIIQTEKEEKPVDAVYCVGEIEDLPANIIIDSGSVSNAISYEYLQTTDRTITKSSNILLSGINGAIERPLGEVIDLKISLGSHQHYINALVMEKGKYDLLLGNIWAYKYNAKLD